MVSQPLPWAAYSIAFCILRIFKIQEKIQLKINFNKQEGTISHKDATSQFNLAINLNCCRKGRRKYLSVVLRKPGSGKYSQELHMSFFPYILIVYLYCDIIKLTRKNDNINWVSL